ncbi:MAG: YggS family pyridoxal phosphate enzyme [Bacteroidetes bacterium 4572_128]|nr:MAG: YggS family pyridoxal phosphate enzyme [Bacteroidetes bacterium 4572_128]
MSISDKIKNFQNKFSKKIKLVAVSKTKSNEMILEAYNSGQRDFGENKIQELKKKHFELPKDILWHAIGHLQNNKIKFIAPFVYMIHSVDSLKILKKINQEAKKNNRSIFCLLQIFIAEEENKFGLNLEEVKKLLNSEEFNNFKNVKICGLMGMATFSDNDKLIRKEFRYLKYCFDEIKKTFFSNEAYFKEISIGMSGDYKIAIEEGSTIVRIGSSIFGNRN